MTIENIDLELLMANQLTVDEFVYLFLLREGMFDMTNKMISNCSLNINFSKLIDTGFINSVIGNSVRLTPKFTELFFISSDVGWAEFRKSYPVKTPSGRRLQLNPKKCKKEYDKIVKGNKTTHRLLIECLQADVKHHITKKTTNYFLKMERWFQDEVWKTYVDEVLGKSNDGDTSLDEYGSHPTTLIT